MYRRMIIIFCSLMFSYSAIAQNTKQIYQIFVESSAVTDEYDKFLTEFFRIATENRHITNNILVNSKYNPKYINILVISSQYENDAEIFRRLKINIGDLQDNIVALRPNLILVGERILAEFILTMYNDTLGIIQAFQVASQDPEIYNIVSYASSLTTFLRMGNIAHVSEGPVDDDHALTLAPTIVRSALEYNDDGVLIKPFYYGLLFVFFHEIAHLNVKESGALLDIPGLLRRWRQNRILAEEERADNEARKQLIASLNDQSSPAELISVLSIANYLRDKINFSLFDSLGPVGVAERFFTFHHRGCSGEQTDTPILRTDNINQVIGGYWNILPILTDEELAGIRRQLRSQVALSSHTHGFLRSEAIVSDIVTQRNDNFPVRELASIKPFVRFYNSMIDSLPYILSDTVKGKTERTVENFLSDLGIDQSRDLMRSDICEDGLDCWIALLDGAGRLEMISQQGIVKYAIIYLPIILEQILREDYNGTEEDVRRYVNNLAQTISYFDVFVGKKQAYINVDSSAIPPGIVLGGVMRQQLIECGFYTHIVSDQQETVEITTLDGGQWVRLKLYPSAHAIEEFR